MNYREQEYEQDQEQEAVRSCSASRGSLSIARELRFWRNLTPSRRSGCLTHSSGLPHPLQGGNEPLDRKTS